jgi:protein-disulfide isomerase
VTLVEFMDFGCPYCARFSVTAHQLASEFGDRLRVVYRQFPIANLHPAAPKAAEASLCAHEQGAFWAIHDSMFANQRRLEVTDLKVLARQLGMDADRFDQCLDGGRYAEQVRSDLKEGMRLGISGTPAAFLNGMPLEGGAVTFDAAAEAVRAELGRQAQGRASPQGGK